jgi:hypothetical protein
MVALPEQKSWLRPRSLCSPPPSSRRTVDRSGRTIAPAILPLSLAASGTMTILLRDRARWQGGRLPRLPPSLQPFSRGCRGSPGRPFFPWAAAPISHIISSSLITLSGTGVSHTRRVEAHRRNGPLHRKPRHGAGRRLDRHRRAARRHPAVALSVALKAGFVP